ncbi:hypothetical protein BGZ70_010193 [Mortierella alpina]|uniref:Cytochrome P450 n=1 Tax=Mortierella alpina TaxID=64518 RepID=A0A9P6IZS6_MORAP|nr:hypothetical protein BGZ70_010193 [Mortierella alpina]
MELSASTLILAIVAFIVYKYRVHAIGTLPRRDLKQPRGAVPLLGHLPLLASIPSTQLQEFFERQSDELGPVWSISLPHIGRVIQSDSPEILEHVLKTNFWKYEKGILLVDGAEWKFQRKLVISMFSSTAVREYTDTFLAEGKKVLGHLGKAADEGSIIDLEILMRSYTFDTFGSVSFGKSFGSLDNIHEDPPFIVSFERSLGICSKRMLNPLWRIREWLTGDSKTVLRDQAMMRQYAIEIFENRRKEVSDAPKTDLLHLLLEAKDDDGNPVPEDTMVDMFLNLLAAGRESTAQSLTWLFYLILRGESGNAVTKQLTQELDEVLKGSEPTYETHRRLKYAEACFYEALRLYPALPRNLRLCITDDILPGGIKIHKGEWFAWSSYTIARSELVWGPDAKEFKPSRWINTSWNWPIPSNLRPMDIQ